MRKILVRILWPALLVAGVATGDTTAPASEKTGLTFRRIELDRHFWNEGATFGDFDRDGKMDVVSGPYWYAGPDFKARHEIYPATQAFERKGADGKVERIPGFEGALGTENVYSDNFFAFTHDFDADGWTDVLVYRFPGKEAVWFENPRGAGGHWPSHVLLDSLDNESPTFADIDGDGRPEIVGASGGALGYAKQESADPKAPWKFHAISTRGEPDPYAHGLGIGDVNGDGRADLIEATGWWEQPVSLQGDPVWKRHAARFGEGAQFHVYDVDGDGLPDVIGSENAHGYGLAWHQQVRRGGQISFRKHVILPDTPKKSPRGVQFSQLHAVDVVDVDGDGLKDIVTGKRFWAHGSDGDPEPNAPAVLYWFQLVRRDGKVDYVPHLIDDDSGVGTQVVVADANGDRRPDIVVGNKKGTFVHLQQFGGLTPAAAAEAMTLPPGFRAHVFAAEPDVKQPIGFAIDDRGRVWVAEAYTYPVRRPEGQGTDRILVFEDRDGDGRFDRRTVFMSGLNLVSGLEIGFGGVWIGSAPHLLFVPLQDGDEPKPAGPPRIVLDGWGYEDTHETLNTFTWGPDGWLYGAHGVFTDSNVGKPGAPDSERRKLTAGIWRYHPTKDRFEVFAEGTSNPWGLDFDENGQMITEACVIPHLWHMTQGGAFQRQAGPHENPFVYEDIKTVADHVHYHGDTPHSGNGISDDIGGGHAHAGLMIYLGGSWPEKYRGVAYMNNIHGARINADRLERRGSGFVGRHSPDLIVFNDPWSQIVNLQYDQDGSLYMIDWYDQEQCHVGDPEVPDRGNGRIFKVVYGDTKTTKVDLQKATDAQLVRSLLSRNEWHVRHARRVLQERAATGRLDPRELRRIRDALGLDGKAVPIAEIPGSHASASPAGQLRLLWALHGAGGLKESDALQLIRSPDEYLRAWTVQLTSEDGKLSAAALRAFADLARNDASPVVRLYLASAAQRVPAASRWDLVPALMAHGEDAKDHNLALMYWYAVEPLVPLDPPRALAAALQARTPYALEFTSRRVASLASPELLNHLATVLLQVDDEARQLQILRGMSSALDGQKGVAMPAGWRNVEEKIARASSLELRDEMGAVSIVFGSADALAGTRATLADESAALPRRERALRSLVQAADPGLPPVLFGLLGEPALRAKAITSLAAVPNEKAPGKLVALYPSLPLEERQEVLTTLTSRPQFAKALLASVAKESIPLRDISAALAANIRALGDAGLTADLDRLWGYTRESSAEKKAEFQRYLGIVDTYAKEPDRSQGRQLFKQSCGVCHRLFGDGGTIGPDITGSNRQDVEYLLHNIVNPNAEVPNAYRVATVTLRNGRVLSGFADQRDPKVVVVTMPNETVRVPKSDVVSLKQAEVSMMPEGLLMPLNDDEVRALIAYLSGSGQVPLPASP